MNAKVVEVPTAPFLVLLFIFLTGCAAAPPYRYGGVAEPVPKLVEDGEMLERGRPNRFVDGVGWVFGIPSKLILWDRRVENHHVTLETEEAALRYIAENGMADVKVRSNQYAPIDEFWRLVDNRRVGVGWRATFGAVSWLGYTLLPGRIFGGDAYNPYTHSIYLYSDVPAVALHEAGHAKDFARRRWPGTYAALGILPLTSLYVEAQATRDVLGYLSLQQRNEELAEAYRILYPAYGTYVGQEIGGWIYPQGGVLLSVAGAIPGHLWGRYQARGIMQGTASEPVRSDESVRSAEVAKVSSASVTLGRFPIEDE